MQAAKERGLVECPSQPMRVTNLHSVTIDVFQKLFHGGISFLNKILKGPLPLTNLATHIDFMTRTCNFKGFATFGARKRCLCFSRSKVCQVRPPRAPLCYKKRVYISVNPDFSLGAEGETRTPTPLPELDPEPSVSTNSTTSAREIKYRITRLLASFFFAPQKLLAVQKNINPIFFLSYFHSYFFGFVF